MASKKNRRRRASDRRRATGAVPAGATSVTPLAPAPPADDPAPLPSLRVRYAGFALALVTIMVALFTLADAISGGYSGADLVARVVIGAALGVLALVIAALALVPERVRGWLSRE